MSEPFDMGALLDQAKAMQEQVLAARAHVAQQVVEGHAGGGAVRVRITGEMDFQSVSIDPQALDLGDVTMLEDLVLAACNDAVARARQIGEEALGNVDLAGLGLDEPDDEGPSGTDSAAEP